MTITKIEAQQLRDTTLDNYETIVLNEISTLITNNAKAGLSSLQYCFRGVTAETYDNIKANLESNGFLVEGAADGSQTSITISWEA